MQVITDILDILPDGTIIRLALKTDPMTVIIFRDEPDQSYMIERIDVVDQKFMEEAMLSLAVHLREYCIYNIDIKCVDGSIATLTV